MTITVSAPVPLSEIEQISSKIADLQLMLQTAAPGYEGLLHQIHVALIKDDALVHLLSEEQIGTICVGLAKKKNLVIADAETKSKGRAAKTASGKALKDISIDEL